MQNLEVGIIESFGDYKKGNYMFTPIIEPPALYYQLPEKTIKNLQAEYSTFLETYPEYATTQKLDLLRSHEYTHIDNNNHIFLDYTGCGLYSQAQIEEHCTFLNNNVYGNPHSNNPTSQCATNMVEAVRTHILNYFNASADEYAVIFTPNATGALKIVGESYPFVDESRFLFTEDIHNSVMGIREFARAKGASLQHIPIIKETLRITSSTVEDVLNKIPATRPCLFAFPAQSNFSGVQHPLEWVSIAQNKGWHILLDAAAFVPTNKLDLSQIHPDFVVLSFYKMFGYPTGVGCLIAKHSALKELKRPWFSGGTVEVASISGDGYHFHDDYSAFEDGTLNFLNISAVPIGLRHIQKIGIDLIHKRVITLTDWLIKKLINLHHSNGNPLICIYGPHDTTARGGIIAMNFQDPDGTIIDPEIIEFLAAKRNISIRIGCFCSPGSIEAINEINQNDVQQYFNNNTNISYEDYIAGLPGRTMAAARVSLGIVSNFKDVYEFVKFAQTFINITDFVQNPFKKVRKMRSIDLLVL